MLFKKWKRKIPEAGLLPDDDPVYEMLDEWHDKDEYEKILAKVEEIPFERRSNELWFRKISALNNLSRFQDARREIEELSPRCTEPKDLGRLCYMLGYIFDRTDCEFKAIECYRNSMDIDPSRTDTPDLIASSMEYAKKDMDLAERCFRDKFGQIDVLFDKEEKKELDDLKAYAFLGLINVSVLSSVFDVKFELENALYKCEEDEKELLRKALKARFDLTDLKSLQDYFSRMRIAPMTDEVERYLHGNSEIEVDKLDISNKTLWDATVMCMERMGAFLPEAGLAAWDFNVAVGLARLMYAADLLTNTELFDTYLFAFDQCRELFASWKEFTHSLVIGAFYNYLSKETTYNIRDAVKFALAVGSVAAETYPCYIWLDEMEP